MAVVKPVLPHGLLNILALLAKVVESVLLIKDFARLDGHLLVGVISHVQALDAICLTKCLRQIRMTVVLLFVRDLYRLIFVPHRIVRGNNQVKAGVKHFCG